MPLLQSRRLTVRRESRKLPLQLIPDEAILRLARVLARQAAREDYERDQASMCGLSHEESRDIRSVLDGPSK